MLININSEFYLEMLKHRCRSMGEVEDGDCRSMGMGRSGGAASSWTWDTGAGGTDSSWTVAAAGARTRLPLPSAVESSDSGTLDTDLTKLNLGCLLSSPQKILNCTDWSPS